MSALCIRNFFTDEKNIEILDRLKEYGVNMRAEETETVESVLTGKTVVVTEHCRHWDEKKRLS